MSKSLPNNIDETQSLLTTHGYVAGRDLSTVVFLALKPALAKLKLPKCWPRRWAAN